MNGSFHLLAHDATSWATGDTLRLEARTLAANTARLTVYRNGVPLFVHDDTATFIEGGQPGIGLWASAAIALDDWHGGELNGMQATTAAPATIARDDFNRVKLTGAIGVWSGVSVRGNVESAHGYWLAVKDDGAYLYSNVNGAFHALAYDPTLWSAGDTVRLEVRTIAPSTARLIVHRNGSPLFTHDDGSHFITGGQPGIGLYASAPVSLDDWEGGTLPPAP